MTPDGGQTPDGNGDADTNTDENQNGDADTNNGENQNGDADTNTGENQNGNADTNTGENQNSSTNTETDKKPESNTNQDSGKVTPDPGPEPIPDPKKGSRPWNLVLVNPWNTIPDTTPELTRISEPYTGWTIDARANADLQQLLADCDAQPGLYPIVCSSYRTTATQEKLFNNKVKSYQSKGLSYANAVQAAARETAWPGTSEHQLGLAVDIVDVDYQQLTDAQADTPVQQWLMANCWKYGFILRYPADKVDITGIKYEPWHYRYVGKEYAKEIYDSGLCLEEWLALN